KGLITHHIHVGGSAGQQRRLEMVAPVHFGRSTTANYGRTLFHRRGDHSCNSLQTLRVDKRSHVQISFSTRVTELRSFKLSAQLLDEYVMHTLLNKYLLRAVAHLTGVYDTRFPDTLCGEIEVCVLKHDRRSLPAQLEINPGQ